MARKLNWKEIAKIYITFLKLGSVSFGGGYAMLSLMEKEIVEEKKWIEKEKIVDIFAVSESLPGAIALNSSAFVGYAIAGIPGAIAALLGNLTPSVLIMSIISILFSQFGNNVYVQNALSGIRPVIVGLIIYAAYKVGKVALKDFYCILIACIALILALLFKSAVIIIILGGILTGLVVYTMRTLLDKLHVKKEKY